MGASSCLLPGRVVTSRARDLRRGNTKKREGFEGGQKSYRPFPFLSSASGHDCHGFQPGAWIVASSGTNVRHHEKLFYIPLDITLLTIFMLNRCLAFDFQAGIFSGGQSIWFSSAALSDTYSSIGPLQGITWLQATPVGLSSGDELVARNSRDQIRKGDGHHPGSRALASPNVRFSW